LGGRVREAAWIPFLRISEEAGKEAKGWKSLPLRRRRFMEKVGFECVERDQGRGGLANSKLSTSALFKIQGVLEECSLRAHGGWFFKLLV